MKKAVIKVNEKDLKKLRKIFPAKRGESQAKYLERYVEALKHELK